MTSKERILAWCRVTDKVMRECKPGKRKRYERFRLVKYEVKACVVFGDQWGERPLYQGDTWEEVEALMVAAGKLRES